MMDLCTMQIKMMPMKSFVSFGIIHCVADSGVFEWNYRNKQRQKITSGSTWKGRSNRNYQPFKRDLPMVVADQEKTIEAPENQYVYRAF